MKLLVFLLIYAGVWAVWPNIICHAGIFALIIALLLANGSSETSESE